MESNIIYKFVSGVELNYICCNYKSSNKNYDEKCIGWNTKGSRPFAIIQRTYY